MAENSNASASQDEKPTIKERLAKTRGFARSIGYAFIALGIFVAGTMVGNGSITFHSNNPQNSGLPNTLDYSSIDSVYQTLRQNYDGKMTEKQLVDGMKSGLAQAVGDPYTEFFNTADAQKFNEQLSGSFSGIGAELGQDADKNLIVVAPISGFPAEKAGLRAKDIITTINGKTTTGISVDEAVRQIRGKKGTQVTLKVVRDKAEQLSITITRDNIHIPSVTHKILDDGIGYMQITQFSEDTADLAQKAAQEFKDKGVTSVILDMRDNPGGLLDSAVKVSSLWLPTGSKILDEKRGSTVINSYPAGGQSLLKGMPTVVLINGGSASAAEITAGALKDNNAAKLLGEKSFGKGSVQQIESFRDGSQIKVTVARWYRPNGQNIDKKGIEPDQKVVMTNDDFKNGNDPQLDAAIASLQGQ